MLRCPVCKEPLAVGEGVVRCARGHTFNVAREGYVNLLVSSKAGDSMGDPKAQARSRRDFLDRGYYAPLRDAVVALVAERARDAQATCSLLDICCGEGYYTSALGAIEGVDAYGFDLSKEMVRLAAKRGSATYFVANLKAIPLADASMDVATHLFAPFHEAEFARVVKPGGTLLSVVPGSRHLFGLKERLYATPYLNDEKLPATSLFELVETHRVSDRITLLSPQDIDAVFKMTPYYYRTRAEDRSKLLGLERLATDIEFVIAEYRRK